ncbi:hypothetical protein [Methylobacterium oryzisoli]|uniref:hypothetical protein n=1 Tax=Methylobacterium oryzisoli TaxID=3385502 RepID=UPI0038914D4E
MCKVRPSQWDLAPTESRALKRAEAIAGRMQRSAALRIVADDETEEPESAALLGQLGEVPDDSTENLQGS